MSEQILMDHIPIILRMIFTIRSLLDNLMDTPIEAEKAHWDSSPDHTSAHPQTHHVGHCTSDYKYCKTSLQSRSFVQST